MGLSADQGRLLMLTSRMSDVNLQQVMISQRQNKLAWESERVASEYHDAMSNYKLVVKVPEGSASGGYEKQDLNYTNLTQLGYLVTNANSEIYLEKDENGDWIIPEDINGNEILEIDGNKAIINSNEYEILDGSKYLSDPKILQNSLVNGTLFLLDTNKESDEMGISDFSTNTEMEYVLDTSDDAEAESKQEYETARIARQDNLLDMDLKQLDTQNAALQKEYDAVKELIDKNIERTFSLFKKG